MLRRIFLNFFTLGLLILPSVAIADVGSDIPSGGGPLLPNPLRFGTIPELISAVLSVMVAFGIPVIALAFAYSGFLFVKGGSGKSGDLSGAKTAFFGAAIGGAIILGAEIIVRVLENTISAL